MEGALVDKILFLFAICRCVPEIFAIKVESCQKALWILDVFFALPNFRGQAFQKLHPFYHPASRHVPWKKFCGDTPTSLEIIGAHTLNFKPNFKVSHSRPQLLYCICSPLVALHWRRNGWPWMTLNGHFALKCGPCLASKGLAFYLSEKTVRKFAELRIYCQQQKCSPARDCTGDISVMELFTGITEQEASDQWTIFTVLYSQFSHMLFTDACRK